MSEIPGWLRTRRFIRVYDVPIPEPPSDTQTLLALHEFKYSNGLSGPEHDVARSTPWRNKVITTLVKSYNRRTYEFSYEFTPAPRDLLNAPGGEIRGKVGVHRNNFGDEGLELEYALEGCPSHAVCADQDASVILMLSISGIEAWDQLMAFYKSSYPEFYSKYRFLRFQLNPSAEQQDANIRNISALLLSLGISDVRALLCITSSAAVFLDFGVTPIYRMVQSRSVDKFGKHDLGLEYFY